MCGRVTAGTVIETYFAGLLLRTGIFLIRPMSLAADGHPADSFGEKDMSMTQVILELLQSFGVTVQIFLVTLLLSLPLGLLVAFGRMSKNPPLKGLVSAYISVMRGTPLMLQLIVVYFGPYYLLRVSVGPSYRLVAVYIAFAINYAAYFAEIYRSGIQSMPKGQYEAAQLLGYNRVQTFFLIIFPQVVKKILPSVTNEVITLVKDTSFAFTLSVTEMFTRAKALAAGQTSIVPLFVAGVFYYIFNYAVAYAFEYLEKRLDYYR